MMLNNSVADLPGILNTWEHCQQVHCSQLLDRFHTIYEVHQDTGQLVIPETFEPKVCQWTGHTKSTLDCVTCQKIVLIRNKVLEEDTVFNPLRQKRPKLHGETAEREQIEHLVEHSSQNCDFCSYKRFTAEDVSFGRIETECAFTIANAFKIEAWNSMVVFRNHHPLNWTEKEFLDATMNTASQWFTQVHDTNPAYEHPFIIWDLLPNGGASQIHTHFHVMLTKTSLHGGLEWWRRRTCHFSDQHQCSYFDVDAEIHESLGLTVRHNSALAMARLTPRKDNEVIVYCRENLFDFYQLLYRVLRAFIEDMSRFSFSLAIVPPTLGMSAEVALPTYARVLTRGRIDDKQADIGSLELFAAPSVGTDPFETAHIIREHMKKYKTNSDI